VTAVYVTHDQVEAMTMGHRVAVLRDGVLQQVDTPRTLHHEPDNLFVAGFIGSPAMNLVPCATGADVEFGGVALPLSDSARGALAGFAGDRVIVGFRPEAVTLGDGTLKGITRVVVDLGAEVFVHLAVDHGGETVSIVAKVPAPYVGEPGEPVPVRVTGAIHLFDPAGPRLATSMP
jgi:multiple sugar transport system ATP-binding protein